MRLQTSWAHADDVSSVRVGRHSEKTEHATTYVAGKIWPASAYAKGVYGNTLAKPTLIINSRPQSAHPAARSSVDSALQPNQHTSHSNGDGNMARVSALQAHAEEDASQGAEIPGSCKKEGEGEDGETANSPKSQIHHPKPLGVLAGAGEEGGGTTAGKAGGDEIVHRGGDTIHKCNDVMSLDELAPAGTYYQKSVV